ncbi:uncharacterized protein LOC136028167 isoform X2 [Artemia franciscana]
MRMNNDSVTECVIYNGQVDVFQSQNLPDDPDVIKRNRRLTENKLGISVQNVAYEEGKLYCQFVREGVLDINGITFDLSYDYYLLLAAGYATSTMIREHADGIAGISLDRIDLDQYQAQRIVDPRLRRQTTIYNECGISKGCFGTSRGCEETRDCKLLVTFKKSTDIDHHEFELYGKVIDPENSYVSVGFSDDKGMGNDSVTECVWFEEEFQLFNSYNRPYVNDVYSNRRSDGIQAGIELIESFIEDGYMYCRFKRATVHSVTYINQKIDFDLSLEWYVLIASGRARSNNLQTHEDGAFASHTRSPVDLDFVPSIYKDCGITRGCFGSPRFCEGTQTCNLIVTYKRSNESAYEFEILGKMYEPENNYLAVGFSFDRGMGNDSVTECVWLDGEFRLYNSFNRPAIGDYFSNRREKNHTGITLLEAGIRDDEMYCRFTRESYHIVQNVEFDLHEDIFVHIASGPAQWNNVMTHEGGGYASHTIYAVSLDEPSIPVAPTTIAPDLSHPIYSGCGDIKGCFGYPLECIDSKSCSLLVSYRNASSTQYEFELYGMVSGHMREGGNYVAVGFSNDLKMDQDSVTECSVVDGINDVTMSYNDGHHNFRLEDPYLGIDKLEVKFEDGYIYCKFLRNGRIAHNGQSFDISGINYHIMLAAGPAEQGLIHEHWEYAVSSEKVDLDDYGKVNARDVQGLITCHGILMTIAWMLIVPVTTLLPRHKQSWNGKKLFSLPPWFALHRLLAIVAVALTACSFIIIFIAKGGWVNVEDQLANSHAVLGVIITVLAILQPLGSMLRPAPDHPKRWLFNVIHACTGYLLFILGMVSIFLGTLMKGEEWARWIVVASGAAYIICQVAYFLLRKPDDSEKSTSDDSEKLKSKDRRLELIWYAYGVISLGLTIAVVVGLA